ncbi:MAG: PilT/PilU family type 4a pilus ATPase [Candidatus Riflebacteria bacterium]|nr:PilT/PilU family type 4a pilus ATPase [Candidatus Riflebacteria bacterium]
MSENRLYELLKLTYEHKASDLHLKVGQSPAVRIDGSVAYVDGIKFSRRDFDGILESLLLPDQIAEFNDTCELDFAYALEGVCRFRVNLYKDINGIGAAFRIIPQKILTFDEVGLPAAGQKLIEQPNGLILVTGPTGAGKTSTLAAFINYVNSHAKRHIVTLEDPVEYQFDDEMCIINQRQIGIDCPSFYDGLLTVLRQDPDIIVVGEMREPRTIALTLNAAETGKLVLSTLHTTSAVQTAERIINVFPENQQNQVLHQLSMVLRGVISQTLLPKRGGGRVAAFEVLLNTSAVRAIIAEGKIHLLPSVLETSSEVGMVTLETSMLNLIKSGLVNPEDAMALAPNPVLMRKMLDGITE